MPKKKLQLNELKVKSFVTVLNSESKEVKGGNTWTICKTCGDECPSLPVCSHYTCQHGTCTCTCDTCETCVTCATCETCETCGVSCPDSICKTCGPECTFAF